MAKKPGKKAEKKADKKPASDKKKYVPSGEKKAAPKQDATEALKERRQARRRARNARESGVGQTLDPKTGKPTQTAKQAAKARRGRVKKTREKARAADKAVRRSDYEGATDRERAKIDRSRERAVKRAQARNEKNRPPRPGEQTRPGEEVGKRPTRKEAVAQRKKYRERRDRLNERQARIDRRQGMNPAEGGTGWNWRWDRDPATTKGNPTGAEETTPTPTPSDNNEQRRVFTRWVTQIGLPPDMVDWLIGKVNGEEIPEDGELEDYIPVLAEHPSFQKRYPVIVEQLRRWQAGDTSQQVWTPAAVLEYEKTVRDAADDYGLSSWVSSPDQISTLILNNVSVDEAKDRINLAAYSAMNAPPQIKNALLTRYGLSDGNLVGFFLDPTKEEQEIRNAVAYSSIVGSAVSRGLGLSWEDAVRMREQGLYAAPATAEMAAGIADSVAASFEEAAKRRGLQSGYGMTVSGYQLASASLGDVAAGSVLGAATDARVGRFNRRSGIADTQAGAISLRTAAQQ